MKKFLYSILTAALALASNKASADLVMNVSATATIQKSNQTNSTAYVGTTANLSVNTKLVYAIVSNAVANVSTWSVTIAPTSLPADGYIAFNPNATDAGGVTGVFYVTNKTGFYYPLSGQDSDLNYYSWIELDSQSSFYDYIGFQDGWVNSYSEGAPFNGPSTYNINKTTGKGSETDTSTALLYIHDDPYSYDDADYSTIYYLNFMQLGGSADLVGYNYNSIEVRGIITATFKTTNFSVTSGSASLSGTGNFTYSGIANEWGNILKSATVTFK